MVKISLGILPLWLSRHIDENYPIKFAFVYQHLISTHQAEWLLLDCSGMAICLSSSLGEFLDDEKQECACNRGHGIFWEKYG